MWNCRWCWPACRLQNDSNGCGLRFSVSVLRRGWITGLIVVTIGGIYVGIFSAVEAAGVGAFLAFIITVIRRKLTWVAMKEVLLNTLKSTATTLFVLIGAFIFTPFVAISGIPDYLVEAIESMALNPYAVLGLVLFVLILLGTFMEGFAILVLTLPLLQPIMETLGFDMIWFGVLMVIVLEMGLISPPVGLNVFIVKMIAPDVPMNDIFKGIMPFWLAMVVSLVILVLFPQIALLLPNTMFG